MDPDTRFNRWRTTLHRKRLRPRTNPTCKVRLDLRGVPWGADPERATWLLKRQPGVVEVIRVDTRRRCAVVRHDATTSLPQLWNWLVTQSTANNEPPKD